MKLSVRYLLLERSSSRQFIKHVTTWATKDKDIFKTETLKYSEIDIFTCKPFLISIDIKLNTIYYAKREVNYSAGSQCCTNLLHRVFSSAEFTLLLQE